MKIICAKVVLLVPLKFIIVLSAFLSVSSTVSANYNSIFELRKSQASLFDMGMLNLELKLNTILWTAESWPEKMIKPIVVNNLDEINIVIGAKKHVDEETLEENCRTAIGIVKSTAGIAPSGRAWGDYSTFAMGFLPRHSIFWPDGYQRILKNLDEKFSIRCGGAVDGGGSVNYVSKLVSNKIFRELE